MKIFKKLNYIFLHDEDETAPLSDYVIFYGFIGFMLFMGTVFLVLNITSF